MDTGMLWYDNDPKRPLAEKVQRAVDFYAAKYGARPTTCYVHPRLMDGTPAVVAGCQMRGKRNVIVNHFWLGVETAVRE